MSKGAGKQGQEEGGEQSPGERSRARRGSGLGYTEGVLRYLRDLRKL